MGSLYTLSFRKLDRSAGGPVLAGQLYEAGVDAAFDWKQPTLDRRIAGNRAMQIDNEAVKQTLFAGKRVLFVIHGFNVGRDDGFGGGALAQDLQGMGPARPTQLPAIAPVSDADLVITVLWPGDWWGAAIHAPPLNYITEMSDVDATGTQFAKFISEYCQRARSISFVTHSLGARVALDTLAKSVTDRTGYRRFERFSTLTLLAAAANADILDDKRYAAGLKVIQRIYVISSVKDEVLNIAFRAGNPAQVLWGLLPNVRDERTGWTALGWGGPALKPDSEIRKKIEWYAIDPGQNHGHGSYMANGADGPNTWAPQKQKTADFLHTVHTGPAQPTGAAWPSFRNPL